MRWSFTFPFSLVLALLVLSALVAQGREPRSFGLPSKGYNLIVHYRDFDLSDDGKKILVLQWTLLKTRIDCAFQAYSLHVVDLASQTCEASVLISDEGAGQPFDPGMPTHVAWRGKRGVVLSEGPVIHGVASCTLLEYDLTKDGHPVRIDEIGQNSPSSLNRYFDYSPDGSTLLYFYFGEDRWHRNLIARTGGKDSPLVENKVMTMVRHLPDGDIRIWTNNANRCFQVDPKGQNLKEFVRKKTADGYVNQFTDYWHFQVPAAPETFVRRFPATTRDWGFRHVGFPASFPVPLLSYVRHDLYLGKGAEWLNLTGNIPPSVGGVFHNPPRKN